MTGQLLKGMIAAGLVGALAAPLVAHHSISAEFDTNKPITFTGKVTKVEWMNPHIYTNIEAKDPEGKVVVYRVEGGPPNSLFRQGWRKDTLKPGDTVTVTGIRAKIPTSMNIGVATITMADGKTNLRRAGPDGRRRRRHRQLASSLPAARRPFTCASFWRPFSSRPRPPPSARRTVARPTRSQDSIA